MKLPPRWKSLERHPLSDEYPDLAGAAAERMLDGVKKHGILNGRKITLHEGQVLDGWQLYQACVEAGVKPEAQGLPKGMTAEEYVELLNDTRRHETQEIAIARAVARRERVAAAKIAGKSNLQIAAEEGVNESTVRHDVDVLRSGGRTSIRRTAKSLIPRAGLSRQRREARSGIRVNEGSQRLSPNSRN